MAIAPLTVALAYFSDPAERPDVLINLPQVPFADVLGKFEERRMKKMRARVSANAKEPVSPATGHGDAYIPSGCIPNVLRGHLKSGQRGTPQNRPTDCGDQGESRCMITGILMSPTEL